jgi:hypothetical protein
MTSSQQILEHLRKRGRAICDDCLSVGLNIRPRQQVNQKANELLKNGDIRRYQDVCSRCGAPKLVNEACSSTSS